MTIDFGNTAWDYARHRAGFPPAFFDRLQAKGLGIAGQPVADIGTGTGTLARGFALRGCAVVGVDPAEPLLEQGRRLAEEERLEVTFRQGSAEETGLPEAFFDLVTAGQCWHWFDRAAAAQEVWRVLKPGGWLVIAHFDWLPLPGNVVEATEQLILKHNPAWGEGGVGPGGTGLYPQWLTDLAVGGFEAIETFSEDLPVHYSHEDWRGRIRASAGVAASLDEQAVAAFDQELAELLKAHFPEEPLAIPHRLWAALGRKPAEG